MAYLKYKELTKYFNFYKELNNDDLASYITDYLFEDEKILNVYATKRDKGLFTNKRIVLFDIKYGAKQIYSISYKSLSTIGIIYGRTTVSLIMYVDSGYPIKLKFINLKAKDKTTLRILFTNITKIINEKNI